MQRSIGITVMLIESTVSGGQVPLSSPEAINQRIAFVRDLEIPTGIYFSYTDERWMEDPEGFLETLPDRIDELPEHPLHAQYRSAVDQLAGRPPSIRRQFWYESPERWRVSEDHETMPLGLVNDAGRDGVVGWTSNGRTLNVFRFDTVPDGEDPERSKRFVMHQIRRFAGGALYSGLLEFRSGGVTVEGGTWRTTLVLDGSARIREIVGTIGLDTSAPGAIDNVFLPRTLLEIDPGKLYHAMSTDFDEWTRFEPLRDPISTVVRTEYAGGAPAARLRIEAFRMLEPGEITPVAAPPIGGGDPVRPGWTPRNVNVADVRIEPGSNATRPFEGDIQSGSIPSDSPARDSPGFRWPVIIGICSLVLLVVGVVVRLRRANAS